MDEDVKILCETCRECKTRTLQREPMGDGIATYEKTEKFCKAFMVFFNQDFQGAIECDMFFKKGG